MSNLHALLIAVDFYFPHTLPEGIFYPPLGGCVRDVGHVEAYLTSQRGLSQQNIIKLAASVPGSSADGPPEPREQWPTYANMVAAFKALIDRTDAGDQVYVHYSGHGGRARTLFPRIKTEGGVDEGLVPLDIGQPDAQYLRDVELAYLIQQLVDKQVLLTVVFDSCHSGVFRAAGAIAGWLPLAINRDFDDESRSHVFREMSRRQERSTADRDAGGVGVNLLTSR